MGYMDLNFKRYSFCNKFQGILKFIIKKGKKAKYPITKGTTKAIRDNSDQFKNITQSLKNIKVA